MPRPVIVVVGLLLSPAGALAGEIFGSLREGGNPRANVAYQVLDQAKRPASAKLQTASNGSFRVSLPPGRFRLVVYVAGEPSADIVSSQNPAQYDFELVRRPDGNYNLARR
jgi:hypothetical protein